MLSNRIKKIAATLLGTEPAYDSFIVYFSIQNDPKDPENPQVDRFLKNLEKFFKMKIEVESREPHMLECKFKDHIGWESLSELMYKIRSVEEFSDHVLPLDSRLIILSDNFSITPAASTSFSRDEIRFEKWPEFFTQWGIQI